jgi:hypothetical protein
VQHGDTLQSGLIIFYNCFLEKRTNAVQRHRAIGGFVGRYEKIREDIKRQEILERARWQFFRIQSTEWFYKNEHVCRKLLKWLTQYSTEPSFIP